MLSPFYNNELEAQRGTILCIRPINYYAAYVGLVPDWPSKPLQNQTVILTSLHQLYLGLTE